MQLSLTSQYALRAMITLASLDSDEALTSSDLAERTGIPAHYVSKIMRQLVVAGLVDSQRGRGGGFRLAQPAASIPLRDVLEVTEFEMESSQCVFGWPKCDPDHPCPLHPVWGELRAKITRWADKHTLASALNAQ